MSPVSDLPTPEEFSQDQITKCPRDLCNSDDPCDEVRMYADIIRSRDEAVRADERARVTAQVLAERGQHHAAAVNRVSVLALQLVNSAALNYDTRTGQAIFDALNGVDGD